MTVVGSYRKYDQNRSGNLNFDELCAAVDDFLLDASEDVEAEELNTAMEMNMQQVRGALPQPCFILKV